jgi:hypothetical protein
MSQASSAQAGCTARLDRSYGPRLPPAGARCSRFFISASRRAGPGRRARHERPARPPSTGATVIGHSGSPCPPGWIPSPGGRSGASASGASATAWASSSKGAARSRSPRSPARSRRLLMSAICPRSGYLDSQDGQAVAERLRAELSLLPGGGPRRGPAPRPCRAASAGQVPEMPSMASTLPVEERRRTWRAFW